MALENVERSESSNRWCLPVVWMLLTVYSLVSAPIPGVNEPHYLCKARTFSDPTWCQRDFFLTSEFAHYCFYVVTGPLTQHVSLHAAAAIGRVMSLLLVAWGWCQLAKACSLGPVAVVRSAMLWLLISSAGSLSGEWIVGGFESKVPAWGLTFVALACWIRGQQVRTLSRILAAGLAAGAATAMHPVIGGWGVVVIAMAELATRFVRQDRSSIGAFLFETVCFMGAVLLTALPGLLPALNLLFDSSLPLKSRQTASYIQVFWRLKHHMDPTEFPPASWIFTLVICSVVFFSVRTIRRRSADDKGNQPALNGMIRLLLMSGLLALAGTAVGWHVLPAEKMQGWAWRATLLKLYPFRLFDGLLPVAAALSTTLLAEKLLHSDEVFSPLQRLTRPFGNAVERSLTSLLFVSLLCCSWYIRPAVPAGYNAELYNDWIQVCDWIRHHTPDDAMVLTPRESCSFKWFAGRAEYVTYKDCPQGTQGILEWNRRLWHINKWTRESSADGRYDQSELNSLHHETQIDLIVTRKLGPFESAPIHEGRFWRVYRTSETSGADMLQQRVPGAGIPEASTNAVENATLKSTRRLSQQAEQSET